MPKRIQQRRTKGWRKPEGAVSVARPGKWGNPFKVDARGVKEAVRLFESSIYYGRSKITVDEVKQHLRGKDLMCWCPLDQPCHADVLLRIANS